MKINRTYSLDIELIEKLKSETNASELINSLLRKHFEFSDMNKLSLSEINLELKKLDLEEEYKKKKKELKHDN
jgi:hypothetical protein